MVSLCENDSVSLSAVAPKRLCCLTLNYVLDVSMITTLENVRVVSLLDWSITQQNRVRGGSLDDHVHIDGVVGPIGLYFC